MVCTLIVLSMATTRVQAQTITLPEQQLTLSDLFGEIKRQTGNTVIFDAGHIPPDRQVTLAMQTGSVDQMLDDALPSSRYAWQPVDNFVVVRTLPAQSSADQSSAAPISARPTREDFENDVKEYIRRNIPQQSGTQTVIRYETVQTVRPHSGVFEYPSRTFIPGFSKRRVDDPFERTSPLLLAVKTNLVWWAARGTLNIGGEVGLGNRTSLELSGGINRWNLEGSTENNKKLAHWVIKPEFRYWLCERFNGHFFGVHALYGQYNVGGYDIPMLFEKEYRYDGTAYGAGVDYGYHLPLAKRWGVEFTAGVGVIMMDHTQFDCAKCGDEAGKFKKTYFGPTELGVKLVFMIK